MATVLITGTNRGIGRELARQYAEEGWRVHATVRSPDKARSLEAIRGDLNVHELDVTDQGEVKNLARKLKREEIDVLIANAGIKGPISGLGELDYEAWKKVLETNAICPVMLAESFMDNVLAGNQKKFVAISSIMGSISENSGGSTYAYRSSKAALNMAWRSLAVDVAGKNAIATMFHPGWVRTDMGGPNAAISSEESASGLRRVIEELTMHHSGRFLDYTGRELPW
jgi:NAD(P)-dependent dehydrogenase (short-subunit alcohol dehydrogenase family)